MPEKQKNTTKLKYDKQNIKLKNKYTREITTYIIELINT